MAERFYSLLPEETLYMNYNANQQQQQQQQQKVMAMGQHTSATTAAAGATNTTAIGDYDYRANATPYFITTNGTNASAVAGVANNNSSSSNAIDINNNRGVTSQRYFDNNYNYNKILPNNMMSKYGFTAGGYIHSGMSAAAYANGVGTATVTAGAGMGLQAADASSLHLCNGLLTNSAAAGIGAQYANANGGGVSYYNRSTHRYVPYSNNRTCVAGPLTASTTALAYPFQMQQQQQFAPLYRSSCTNLATNILPLSLTEQNAASILTPNTASYEPNLAMPSVTSSDFNAANVVTSTMAAVAAKVASTNTVADAVTATTNYVAATKSKLTTASTNGAIAVATNPSSSLGAVGSGVALMTSTPYNAASQTYASVSDPNQTVTLQITNLDYSMDEASLRNFLLNQLKPITPVVSLVFEGSSYAKVTVPDLFFAKQVVSNLHRKKIGHKRMLVSYTRDSSLTEINTLRCQVAGLLKDVPYYTLPMYKFRELFQSRFKTSISVLDLYKMQDICTINSDNNEDKFISLQPELVNSLESSPLMEGLQHSVPYCTIHFKREQHKGWAEQDIEPLPNVCMTITEIQKIIYPLLKSHTGDIPVASLVHCIEGELNIKIITNENGVNLEHLVCCVQGIQIQVNNFGIKILGWLELDKDNASLTANGVPAERNGGAGGLYSKNSLTDPLYQISREVIELVKMSPKSTMKFNRFIPAYHNHFGKQCRVADYGYTKLIELFEALSMVVQIIGDGENRHITLTHRTQIRRFTSDLLRMLRAHGNKSILLSQLPTIFAQTQNRNFDVTDYGVCDIVDILDGLVNSNIVVVTSVQNGKDILISIPKRKQTNTEVEKTCIFAGEMVELFRNAPQYTILFQKFVRSYHYHFAYQCRLSDFGFLKLADLMEAINGVVDMELTNDEDKKIFLSPKVARRVFAEQCEELIRNITGSSKTCMKIDEVLQLHKKKYGYQIQPQTLGVKEILEAIKLMPYIELLEKDNDTWIICHNDDAIFRVQCYRACKHLLLSELEKSSSSSNSQKETKEKSVIEPRKQVLNDFISDFNEKFKENLTVNTIKAMKHAIEITKEKNVEHVQITNFTKFLITIIRILEQRPSMLLVEIKNALECDITTTFEFSYPNLFSILTAYPDIFSVNLGSTQERSEVALLPNCELRLPSCSSRHHLFGSLKLPYAKQKITRPARMPLGEHNARSSCNTQGPPAKTRALSNDLTQSNAYRMHNMNNIYYQPQATINTAPTKSLALQQAQTTTAATAKQYTQLGSNTSGSTIYSTASNQSSILNISASNMSNKENSFNTSLNLFNVSFNSSNNSMADLNASLGGNISQISMIPAAAVYPHAQTTKLWDRRHASYYQHQQQPQQKQQATLFMPTTAAGAIIHMTMPMTATASAGATVTAATTTALTLNDQTAGLYELVSNIQMCPMYEPPKPDTPPADNMPFWIDPIWTNNTDTAQPAKNDLLNIKLPEMKAFNVLPMLLSPYTISKTENMKQQVFNFDSHDRKIA